MASKVENNVYAVPGGHESIAKPNLDYDLVKRVLCETNIR